MAPASTEPTTVSKLTAKHGWFSSLALASALEPGGSNDTYDHLAM